MAVSDTAKYNRCSSLSIGLVKSDGVNKNYLRSWNVASHLSSHSKVLLPLSSMKKGRHQLEDFGMNQLSIATQLASFWMCCLFFGDDMFKIACTSLGLASIPRLVTR